MFPCVAKYWFELSQPVVNVPFEQITCTMPVNAALADGLQNNEVPNTSKNAANLLVFTLAE
jgi:hypothetical protein